MKYMLLMYANAAEAPAYTPEQQQAAMQAWFDYMKEAKAAGVLVINEGVAPDSTATTVRVRHGQTLTADGPFAETHEQLGGFSVLDCQDLDEAIRWSAKIPTAKYGTIEIRPLWSPQS